MARRESLNSQACVLLGTRGSPRLDSLLAGVTLGRDGQVRAVCNCNWTPQWTGWV